MAITRLHIDQFLEQAKNVLVLDVRSPGEYKHAHFPGALSLPLFTDEERAVVGTAYKQESREKAIKIGLDFFGPKMRKMVEEVETLLQAGGGAKPQTTEPSPNDKPKTLPAGRQGINEKPILLYCWRGGMRSAGVAWLLDLYGFNVYTLVGGYKSFRRHVLESFKKEYDIRILAGYTGSGKTEVLKEMERRGERIIDLEGLAHHKGSAFGNIGMPDQPSQEMFENRLALELIPQPQTLPADRHDTNYKLQTNNSSPNDKPIWIEDESQRIGHVNIPIHLWQSMRRSPVFFLDIPFEERLKFIVSGYGKLDMDRMINAIVRIRKRLGGLEAKNAINQLVEGNTEESFRILLKYYDRWYLKSLHNREELNSLLHTVNADSVTTVNALKLMNLEFEKWRTRVETNDRN